MPYKMPEFDKSQKIYVYRESENIKYASYIKKTDGHALYIYTPFQWQSKNKLKTLRLKEGEKINVHLPLSGQLMKFSSTVLSGANHNCALTAISFPEHMDEMEMRKYIRLSKVLKIQYALVPGPDEEYEFKKAESINISAGGMKLLVPEFIEQGKQVILQFILPMENNYSKLRMLSRVKRSDRTHKNDAGNIFYIGVEFIGIKKNDLDIIKKYTAAQKYMSNLVLMLAQKAKED